MDFNLPKYKILIQENSLFKVHILLTPSDEKRPPLPCILQGESKNIINLVSVPPLTIKDSSIWSQSWAMKPVAQSELLVFQNQDPKLEGHGQLTEALF